MNLKLGKLPPERKMSTPALGDFLPKATDWPAVPPQGWETAVPASSLSMLGNGPAPDNPPQIPNGVGDCACAGMLGLMQAMSYNAGRPLIPTTEDALTLYAQFGFNINAPVDDQGNNPTDQGCVLTDVLSYAQNTGVTIGGTTHKILGFASVDFTSIPLMRYATYLFGGLYLGINCPASAEDTSNWTYVPNSPNEGGHCVVRVGEGAAGGKTRSWGMFIPTTNEFYLKYLDEAYVIVTHDWISQISSKTPTGLDINGLLAAMKGL